MLHHLPQCPCRRGPTPSKKHFKNFLNFKKWCWVMHWDRTEDGETRQSLTFRELNWGRIQKHGILKPRYLSLFFSVSLCLGEGGRCSLFKSHHESCRCEKKSGKRKPWGVLKSYLSPYWVIEVGQEKVKVH